MRRYTTILEPRYGAAESRAVVRYLLEECFGMSYADALCGGIDALSAEDKARLEAQVQRLVQGEPVQYVTGKAWFAGRCFDVKPGVLIPRPETEELVELVRGSIGAPTEKVQILDVGTGSGCIAITLALELKQAQVTAMDVSEDALNIAMENARNLCADVRFMKADILTAEPPSCIYDCIVSNPPYICDNEKVDMEQHVLEHEPHLALFVPDNDPLLFYRAIAKYALKALKTGGALFFEVNALYATDTAEMLRSLGYADVEIHDDAYGKPRMISCKLTLLSRCAKCFENTKLG